MYKRCLLICLVFVVGCSHTGPDTEQKLARLTTQSEHPALSGEALQLLNKYFEFVDTPTAPLAVTSIRCSNDDELAGDFLVTIRNITDKAVTNGSYSLRFSASCGPELNYRAARIAARATVEPGAEDVLRIDRKTYLTFTDTYCAPSARPRLVYDLDSGTLGT